MVRASGEAFSHMSEDWEFKLDPPPSPPGASGTLTAAFGQLSGGMTANPNMTLTVNMSSPIVMSSWNLGWNSPANITMLVSAIIVKGGSEGTNVYPYNPLSVGDTGPFTVTGGTHAISHLSFCFEPFLGPSSAPGSISGRVLTVEGMGIGNTRISAQNLKTGEMVSVITNSFGYYTIEGLTVTDTYIVTAENRKMMFFNNQRTITLDDNLDGIDFVAASW
jgi:hypothetical protein